jgi:hypothetical protein
MYLGLNNLGLNYVSSAFNPMDWFINGEQGAVYEADNPDDFLRRRNLLAYTEQFSNAVWTKINSSITPDAVVAPDGTTTADKLVEAAAAATQHRINQPYTTALVGGTYTFSIYAKAAERRYVQVRIIGAATLASINFDLQTGTITSTLPTGTGVITDVGGGIYRCTVISTAADQATLTCYFNMLLVENGSVNYDGDGVSGCYVWGAQLEANTSASEYQKITDWTTEYIAAVGPSISAYQENTGITPVTAPGQGAADCVIGFLVDKRLGGRNALGAELAPATVNFENAFWTASSATPTGNSFTTAGAGGMSTTASLVVAAKYYEVVMTLANSSTVSLRTSGAGADLVTFAAAASREVRAIINAAGTAFYIRNAAAGTTTVTALSVRELPGNHATQATTASKPVLSARYNQFVSSEDVSTASWTKTECTASGNTLTGSVNTGIQRRIQQVVTTGTAPSKITFRLKMGTQRYVQLYAINDGTPCINFDLQTGTLATIGGSGGAITDAGNGYYDCSLTWTGSGGTVALGYLVFVDSLAAARGATHSTASTTLLFARADLRTSADAALSIPAYQRVVDASNYDTASFPCRIKFDGFDDSLQTAAVDFTGTDKMTVVAGIQKLSDAAGGIVAELSSSSVNPGICSVRAPTSSGANNFSFQNRGVSTGSATAVLAAPTIQVLTGQGNIGGNTATLRLNGAVAATNTDAQGGGNYGNYVINVGRRNAASAPLNAYLTRLIIRGAATPDSQIIKAERSTALKMGLPL